MKLDFLSLNEELINKDEEYSSKMIEYAKVDMEYQETLDRMILESPGASQAIREAQARQALRTDHKELFEKWNILGLEVKLLNRRLQTITTVCSNLRSIGYSEK